MNSRSPVALLAVVAAAALLALIRREPGAGPRAEAPAAAELGPEPESAGMLPEGEELPPGHPPIGAPGEGAALGAPAELRATGGEPEEPQDLAVTWQVPARWIAAPNPNDFRLATYRVPGAQGGPGDAELTVSRAGGGVAANLDRWEAQFSGATGARRSSRTVNGLHVDLLEVSGTFSGGMGPAAGPRADWSLAGAVVQAVDGAYFFKMTGPTATVKAAASEFEALVKSLAPAKSISAGAR